MVCQTAKVAQKKKEGARNPQDAIYFMRKKKKKVCFICHFKPMNYCWAHYFQTGAWNLPGLSFPAFSRQHSSLQGCPALAGHAPAPPSLSQLPSIPPVPPLLGSEPRAWPSLVLHFTASAAGRGKASPWPPEGLESRGIADCGKRGLLSIPGQI